MWVVDDVDDDEGRGKFDDTDDDVDRMLLVEEAPGEDMPLLPAVAVLVGRTRRSWAVDDDGVRDDDGVVDDDADDDPGVEGRPDELLERGF